MISKLVLGTAQLGMSYGINNAHGQPTKEEVFAILDHAWNSGINAFDTSFAYGNAEPLLGEWLHDRDIRNKTYVVTKAKGDRNAVDIQLRRSFDLLGVEKLYSVLLHVGEGMYVSGGVEVLMQAKERGDVLHTGISVYTPDEAFEALGHGFDHIQIPYNVFDRRFDESGFLRKAKEMNRRIFARSSLLQGLLLMKPETVPENLHHAVTHIQSFHEIARSFGVSPQEAAIMFVKSNDDIDNIVFGADGVSQVEDMVRGTHLDVKKELVEHLLKKFASMDESIIDPSLWKRK